MTPSTLARRAALPFLLSFAIGLGFPGPAPCQSPIWNPANGHTYFLTPAASTWHQARTLAASYGGYLVSINDAAEHAWLEASFCTSEILWIGLTDEVQEGLFVWESGEPLAYTNWPLGEPNNSGGNEDYVELREASSPSCARSWNDATISLTHRAIVEVATAIQGQPLVVSVVPAVGPQTGGTPVTITGLNFTNATSATIGSAPLSNFVVVDDGHITGTTTPASVGPKTVLVNAPLSSGSLPNGFVYHPDPLPPDLMVNGGFESGPLGSISAISSAITGWMVTSGNVEIVTNWQPAEGSRSLDLNGSTAGTIQQTIATLQGHVYLVVFELAGNPDGGPTNKSLRIDAPGAIELRTFSVSGASHSNMGWRRESLTFTANATTSTIVFSSLNSGSYGPAIDDVHAYELLGPLRVEAPGSWPVGSPLVWNVGTEPAEPYAPYYFDVSFGGDSPGYAVPPPLPGPIPLNPPYLNLVYGYAFPWLFHGFIGLLDANGNAAPSFDVPLFAGLVGLDLYAACVTFDPFGPQGLGLISNGAQTTFVSPVPVISGVNPGTGSSNGGETVSISGALFLAGATVTFGGLPASNVQVVDPTTITCVTPPQPGATVDVVVANPGGVAATLPAGFAYYFANPAPTVAGIAPSDGPVAGNAPVVITGTGFLAGADVRVGGASCTNVVVASPTTIQCSTPPGALGSSDVVVTNFDTQSATLSAGFTYIPDLALTSVTPLVSAPGTAVTLDGVGFQAGLQVFVGGMQVTPSSVGPSRVVFVNPAGAPCTTSVQVTNPSTQTAMLPFNPAPQIVAVPGGSGPSSGGGAFLIVGNHFFPGTTVTVGGATASIQAQTLTAIFASAPPGLPGPAQIVVTSPSGCTALATYGYQ